jgi:hypothetical protein
MEHIVHCLRYNFTYESFKELVALERSLSRSKWLSLFNNSINNNEALLFVLRQQLQGQLKEYHSVDTIVTY